MKHMVNRYRIIKVILSIILICSLESCSKSSEMDIIFNNETSDTVVVTQIEPMTIDTLYRMKPISIYPHRTIVIISDYNPKNHIPYSDVTKYMVRYFPNGLNIAFQSGKSYTYHPDSITTEPNSPYDKDSYSFNNPNEYPPFLIGGKSDFIACYSIEENDVND